MIMVRMARWCVRRRNTVIAGWVVLLIALGAALSMAGTAFSDSAKLPSSDSATAYALLGRAGSDAASATTGTIVWSVGSGSATEGDARADIQPVLAKAARVDGVARVLSPFAAGGTKQVSADGRTAYATVMFKDVKNSDEVKDLATHADNSRVDVQTGGRAFTNQEPSELTEAIGVLAALVILLLVFRSVWAAFLPIITGVAGVGVSTLIVMLLSNVMTLPSVAISMGVLIGLGVGIDYAVFIVNRQRKALRAGATPAEAVQSSMNTSGRAVLFAGGTVLIALLGMLVLNVGILTAMAVSAGVTVALTVAAAVTLLPALLTKLGPKVLSRHDRKALRAQHALVDAPKAEAGLSARWAALVQRRPKTVSLAALAIVVALAVPVLVMRLGSADASSDPSGTTTRTYYDTMSRAFGAGFQSQLLLVAETPDAASTAAWEQLVHGLPQLHGVASVSPPTTVGTSDALHVVSVTPTTTSQAEATSDLVHEMRTSYVEKFEGHTGLRVHVGGTTATAIDFAKALTSKLPVFLIIISCLGFVLLMIAFRSLVVPAVGALGNILSIGVALGVTVAMFQWGWGPSVFGVGAGAPVEYIVAILMVGVVFGLSMDYHVFLVSRIHEEFGQTRDHRRAIRVGMTDSGKVIATAAAIMGVVFASFGLSGVRTTSEFGVGLALAVLGDAFLIRMTIVPAVMHMIGERTWSLPRVLDKILPHVSVEGHEVIGTDAQSTDSSSAQAPAGV